MKERAVIGFVVDLDLLVDEKRVEAGGEEDCLDRGDSNSFAMLLDVELDLRKGEGPRNAADRRVGGKPEWFDMGEL